MLFFKHRFLFYHRKTRNDELENILGLFYFVQNGSKKRRWFTLCIVEVLLTEKKMYQAIHHFYKLCKISHDEESPTREFLKRESKRDEQTRINKAWEHSRNKSPGSSGISKKPKLRVWLENTSRVTCFTDENSFSSIQILSTLGLGLFIFILHIWSSCLSFFCIYKGKTASPEACTTETGTIYTRSLQENLV